MTAPTFEVIQPGYGLVLAPEALYVTETPTSTRYGDVVKLRRDPGRDSGPTEVSTTRLSGSHAMPKKYMRVVPGATTKICRRCREERPIEQFGIRRLSKDGRVSYCRDCLFLPEVIERKRATTRAHRAERIRMIASLKSGPCMDCGGTFPTVCMQFDHRDPTTKRAKVSVFSRGGTMARFMAEVEKCDLVCANCHAIRTERRRVERLGRMS